MNVEINGSLITPPVAPAAAELAAFLRLEDVQKPFVIERWMPKDASDLVPLENQCWAPWLRQTESVFQGITDTFPQGQFLIRNEQRRPVASLTTNRINWDGNLDTLPTWDEVAGSEVSQGDYSETYDPDGNTVVLMSMNVDPDPAYRGQKFPSKIMEELKVWATTEGIDYIISPFRPSNYGETKLKALQNGKSVPDFEEYCNTMRPDEKNPGEMVYIDGWLRNLQRNGMKPLKIIKDAMKVTVSKEKFKELKATYNSEKWIFDENRGVWECGEVGSWKVSEDEATYVEDNFGGIVYIRPGATLPAAA